MDIIHSSQHFLEIIPIIQAYECGVKFFVATSNYVTGIWTPAQSLKMIWCGKDANLE